MTEIKVKAILCQYFKGNRKYLKLENLKLSDFPFDTSLISECHNLSIRKNCITTIQDVDLMQNLTDINISFNNFNLLPASFGRLRSLRVLNVSHNQLQDIEHRALDGLTKLEMLNLSHNRLTRLPDSIGSCRGLRKLFCSHNELKEIPDNLCLCRQFTDLELGYNRLRAVPEAVGDLYKLRRLILHKNMLQHIPENIVDLVSLRVLDIAANNIQIMPSEINDMSLDEFYFEANPMMRLEPIPSEGVDEVMPLMELCLRVVSKEMQNRGSYLHVKMRHFPLAQEILDDCGECVLCGGAYRDIWIECVEFTPRSVQIKSSPGASKNIPVRATICSHRCFNSKPHNYYGVANLD